jgi:hypothetical protein
VKGNDFRSCAIAEIVQASALSAWLNKHGVGCDFYFFHLELLMDLFSSYFLGMWIFDFEISLSKERAEGIKNIKPNNYP